MFNLHRSDIFVQSELEYGSFQKGIISSLQNYNQPKYKEILFSNTDYSNQNGIWSCSCMISDYKGLKFLPFFFPIRLFAAKSQSIRRIHDEP